MHNGLNLTTTKLNDRPCKYKMCIEIMDSILSENSCTNFWF